MLELTEPVRELVAERFKGLAEPSRLAVLAALRGGERNVTELATVTGLGQANLSRHLHQLHRLGFVERRRQGAQAYYSLAGEDVLRLCEAMCRRIEADAVSLERVLAAGPAGTETT
jgi:DNA-binding transcriptional ArsR family regulator